LPPVDTSELPELPEGWVWARLGRISKVNPKFNKEGFPDDIEVTFLPMRCVEELTGHIDLSQTKKSSKDIHLLLKAIYYLLKSPLAVKRPGGSNLRNRLISFKKSWSGRGDLNS